MARVTVEFNNDSVSKDIPSIEDLLSNRELAGFLGYDPSRVEAQVNGVVLREGVLRGGDHVLLVVKANTMG